MLPCEVTNIDESETKLLTLLEPEGLCRFSHQADLDAVHHEAQDVLLEALLAGGRQRERRGGVRDGGGAALLLLKISRVWSEELLVWRVRDVQEVE